MDLNQLTRDADELIRKVVSRYNQLYAPAGNISQVELDLMLDDMRKLYETFKTIGYVNLSLQNALSKPEVSVKSALPGEAEKTGTTVPSFNESPVQSAEPASVSPQPEPSPEPQPEISKEFQPEPAPETQTETTPKPILQLIEEQKKETLPEPGIAEQKEPEVISEPEIEAKAIDGSFGTIEPENEKPVLPPTQKVNTASTPEQIPTTLADRFTVGNKSLSETIGSSQPQDVVGSRMMFHPISDLSSGIGLNDKFSFISELFDNNPVQYDEAITRINKAVNFDEASWILHKYQAGDWDQKQELLKRLKDFIKRRFI